MQIRRRRTHRGGFRPERVPAGVLAAIRHDAEREGARLVEAMDADVKGALAALTTVAEHVQQRTGSHAAEIARWAPSPRTSRTDGVQERAYPQQIPQTTPHFPARDFARGHGWGAPSSQDVGTAQAGLTLVLVTDGDAHPDWLRTGQAMQRVLLRATERDLAAAFHTQALEVPEPHAFISAHFCNDAHPQMLLRLGVPHGRNWEPSVARSRK